jgi:hypothetical protein
MGYAKRYNDQMHTWLWTASGVLRLRLLWTFLRKPWTRTRLRSSFWAWLTHKHAPVLSEDERLARIASRLRSVEEMDALIRVLPEDQRLAVRAKLVRLIRQRRTA